MARNRARRRSKRANHLPDPKQPRILDWDPQRKMFTLRPRCMGTNQMSSRWKWSAEKKRWRLLFQECQKRHDIPQFKRPLKLFFRCFERNACRDVDNAYGGARKIVLDAMKKAGIIFNDGQRWVRGFGEELPLIDRKDPRVEVEIVEI